MPVISRSGWRRRITRWGAPAEMDAGHRPRVAETTGQTPVGRAGQTSTHSRTAAPCFRTDQCSAVTLVASRVRIVLIYGINSTALFTAYSLMGLYRKRK